MKQDTSISWRLLLRKISGEPLDAAEEARLQAWLNESPAHRDYFERAARHWRHPEAEEVPDVDMERLVRRFDRFAARNPQRPRSVHMRARLYPYVACAAAILLLVSVYMGARLSDMSRETAPIMPSAPTAIVPGSNYAQVILADGTCVNLNRQAASARPLPEGMDVDAQSGVLSYAAREGEGRPNTLIVPRGGQYTLQLEDGTRIWVNADSRLRYPTRFSGPERIVELSGEAYFEVAKDAKRPFIVRTRGQSVKVYGTSFNVEAYSDEPQERTTLATGSVGVTCGGKEIRLIPGRQAVADVEAGTMFVRTVDPSVVCSWHTGVLAVENERLENILARLSRWYDVGFIYRNDELRNLHFTGDLERYADFNDILRLIRMTTSVDFIVNGRQVEVVSR